MKHMRPIRLKEMILSSNMNNVIDSTHLTENSYLKGFNLYMVMCN